MAFLQSRKVNAETILVGVVGVTGSGKSSFIKRVTGRKDIIAVNGSDSGKSMSTSRILVHFSNPGHSN
jgi:ribosome biogenesis GTPase A